MNKEEMKDLARLESKVDILEAELSYLDTILRKSGFLEGISTLKNTLEEILSEYSDTPFPHIDEDGLFA